MSLTKRSFSKAPQKRDSIGYGGVCSSFLARGYCTKYNCNYLHKFPLCKYYQTPGGCWKGDTCRYKHDRDTEKINTTTLRETKSKHNTTTRIKKMACNSTSDSTENKGVISEPDLNPFRGWIHTSKRSICERSPLPSDCPSPDNPFRVGMKLEAVDRKYPGLFCVASILRVTGDELLIFFDGWSDDFNYWCRFNSPEIRPILTCERNNICLNPPNHGEGASNLWHSSNRNWQTYLTNTGASTLPDEEFSPLYLPQSDSPVFSLSELSARVLLFYQMDTSKLPAQLQKRTRIQEPMSCSECETKFLVGWLSVRMFTCQHMLDPTDLLFKHRTRILCTQRCAIQFSMNCNEKDSSVWH